MKGGRRFLAVMALLLPVVSASHAVAGNMEERLQSLCSEFGATKKYTIDEAYDILRKEGFSVTRSGDKAVVITLNGIKHALLVMSDGDFQMYYGATGGSFSLRKINDWNRRKRLSKAYIDKDGDVALEADFDMSNGATRDQLVQFVKLFVHVSVPAFRKFLLDK